MSVSLGQGLFLSESGGQLQINLEGLGRKTAPTTKTNHKTDHKDGPRNIQPLQRKPHIAFGTKPQAVVHPIQQKRNAEQSKQRTQPKKNREEETVTLTKGQLDALVNTINEVCQIAENAQDSPLKLVQSVRKRNDDHDDTPRSMEIPGIDTPHKEKQKPTKGKARGEENIMNLFKSSPKRQDSPDGEIHSYDAKPRDKRVERVRGVHKSSMISKATSPIIVFEPSVAGSKKRSTQNQEATNKKGHVQRKRRTPSPPTAPSLSPSPRKRSVSPSPRKSSPSTERHQTENEKPMAAAAATLEAPKVITLGEKKRLQWERENRENSALKKSMVVREPPPAKKLQQQPRMGEHDAEKRERGAETKQQSTWSPRRYLDQPSAMLDHFLVTDENEVKRMRKKQQDQWIHELEKQKEEQRVKKLMEKELRKSYTDLTPRRRHLLETSVLKELEKEQLFTSGGDEPDDTDPFSPGPSVEDARAKQIIQKKFREFHPAQDARFLHFENANKNWAAKYDAHPSAEHEQTTFVSPHKGPPPEKVSGDTLNSSGNLRKSLHPHQATEDTGAHAYNSTQADLVFHQTFEDPVPVTDRDRNDFGRFKALIDPAEVERMQKERARQQQHIKAVQEQVEHNRRMKEEERLRRQREDLEDELRLRKEIDLMNKRSEDDRNRHRQKVDEQQRRQEEMIAQLKETEQLLHSKKISVEDAQEINSPRTRGSKTVASNARTAPAVASSRTAGLRAEPVIDRQESDIQVEYIPPEYLVSPTTQAQPSSTFVEESSVLRKGQSSQPPQQPVPPQAARRRPAPNTREMQKRRKDTLVKHNQNMSTSRTTNPAASRVGKGQKKHQHQPQASNRRSPPVPTLQKNNLKKPVTVHTRRTAAADSHRTEASRYVDSNARAAPSPPPVSSGQFVPFRRTSATMDPAIDEPDGGGGRGNESRLPVRRQPAPSRTSNAPPPPTGSVSERSQAQRQDAILKQLSSLRQGLIEKQREYDTVTPTAQY